MNTCTLTVDELEADFAEHEADGGSITDGRDFYEAAGEMFPNTDPRVIHAAILTVLESNDGDLESSQVRRVITALADGFTGFEAEDRFLNTFNAEYPALDEDDRAQWENNALIVQIDGSGELRWSFE
ncbi:CUE domain-containing protein [Burkholderia multivorans]|nr:CUE domain-containing protein [Burkholderia multivorans]